MFPTFHACLRKRVPLSSPTWELPHRCLASRPRRSGCPLCRLQLSAFRLKDRPAVPSLREGRPSPYSSVGFCPRRSSHTVTCQPFPKYVLWDPCSLWYSCEFLVKGRILGSNTCRESWVLGSEAGFFCIVMKYTQDEIYRSNQAQSPFTLLCIHHHHPSPEGVPLPQLSLCAQIMP